MKLLKCLALTFVAALVTFSCVAQSSPLEPTSQGQQPLGGERQGIPQVNDKAENKAENKSAAKARYLGGVGGYEALGASYGQAPIIEPLPLPYSQPILPTPTYSAPLLSSSYAPAPILPSYSAAPAYSAPVASSYSAPLQVNTSYAPSYSAPIQQSYSAPVQSYSAPIQQSYSAPVQSYSAPVQSYSAPVQSYSAPVQSYSAPVQSYSTPAISSYSAPVVSSYEQPIAQTYQQPLVSSYSNYSTAAILPQVSSYSNYSAPAILPTQTYSAPVQQSYSAPVQSYSAPVQSYSTPVQSYSAPVQQSYSAPVQSYSAPVQSYSAPVQSYSAPVQSYSAPVQSYSAPIQQSYSAPVQSYSAPIISTPTYSNYSTPVSSYSQPIEIPIVQNSYSAPIVETTSYQQPIQSYSQPIQQSYSPPVQSYSAPVQQSYSAPVQQSYSPPVQSYSAPIQQSYSPPVQSYSAPIQQSYSPPIQSYSQPIQGTIYKRELTSSSPLASGNETTLSPAMSSTSGSSPTDATAAVSDDDRMSTSESQLLTTYVPAPPVTTITSAPIISPAQPSYVAQPAQQLIQKQQLPLYEKYLDIQPEFTQSWADFYLPPGYLPIAFRSFPYQAQAQNKYGAAGYNQPQNVAAGYITWSGPINPATFYLPLRLPYYYRIPQMAPYYLLNQATVLPVSRPVAQVGLLTTTTYKVSSGYAKRSLGHDAAPYQLLVDHLAAAASENKEIFTNVSSIECPAKPTAYTCPQVLSKQTKEELTKRVCDYETILTGNLSLVPDTEKAQTRCGAFRITKQDAKNIDDISELPEKVAIVMGKDCLPPVVGDKNTTNTTDQLYILVKTTIPSGTKFILADGSNIDLVSSQSISKDELSSVMKQCPKKSQ